MLALEATSRIAMHALIGRLPWRGLGKWAPLCLEMLHPLRDFENLSRTTSPLRKSWDRRTIGAATCKKIPAAAVVAFAT